jgi:hypothetical protein
VSLCVFRAPLHPVPLILDDDDSAPLRQSGLLNVSLKPSTGVFLSSDALRAGIRCDHRHHHDPGLPFKEMAWGASSHQDEVVPLDQLTRMNN